MILAGLCDLLDGPVARRQGRVSLFGGFLDSIFDRYADLILFLGLLVYYVAREPLPLRVAGRRGHGRRGDGQLRESARQFAGARIEVGFWERPERLALMIIGALTNRMSSSSGFSPSARISP